MEARPVLSLRRALESLLAGGTVGGALIAIPYLAGQLAMSGGDHLGATLAVTAYVFAVAVLLWVLGLIVLGGPLWWFLHRLGLRGWVTAAIAGFGLPVVVTMVVAAMASRPMEVGSSWSRDSGGLTSRNGVLTAHGWANQARGSVLLGVAGAVVAITVRAYGYGRRRRTPTLGPPPTS